MSRDSVGVRNAVGIALVDDVRVVEKKSTIGQVMPVVRGVEYDVDQPEKLVVELMARKRVRR